MKKAIILLLLTFLTSGCTDNNQSKTTMAEIKSLRKENDSLKNIIDEINNKFIFDSVFIKTINNPKNSYKPNSDYEMEILFVGYNPDKSYFVKYDSIVDGKKINPDSLLQKNGSFKYKTKLTKQVNKVQIEVNMKNEYGQEKKGKLTDLVRIKN